MMINVIVYEMPDKLVAKMLGVWPNDLPLPMTGDEFESQAAGPGRYVVLSRLFDAANGEITLRVMAVGLRPREN